MYVFVTVECPRLLALGGAHYISWVTIPYGKRDRGGSRAGLSRRSVSTWK